MVVTPEEADRISAIVAEAQKAGLPPSQAMSKVRVEFPNVTRNEVRQLLRTRHEEAEMDLEDAEAEANAVAKMRTFMARAARLTGNPAIGSAGAIAFFTERADACDEEAKALLASIDDPFLRL